MALATDFVTNQFHNHCNRIKITTSVTAALWKDYWPDFYETWAK